MHQLFVDSLPPEGSLLSLGGDERHYLGRALRARPGERFRLAAVDGSAATALLESFSGDSAMLRVGAADPDPDLGLRLSLDLCPPRGDALDEALEMAVQLGVESLRFVRSERTLAALDQGALQADKIQRRLREACRQCLRARQPMLEPSVAIAEGLASIPGDAGLKLIMSERGGLPLGAISLDAHSPLRVLVGPEGGFSAAEFESARLAGWQAISLGPHPLKTATAVAAALASLRALSAPLLSPPPAMKASS